MESFDMSGVMFSKEERQAVESFCRFLTASPDLGLQSIVLYGSAARDDYRPGKSDINILLIVRTINVSVLRQMLDQVAAAHEYGIAPFFITESDLRTSSAVFPGKFLSIRESSRLLWGANILDGLIIDKSYLHLRCIQELVNLLLRLRQYYVMRGANNLTQMLANTVGGFFETMRVLFSTTQATPPLRMEMTAAVSKEYGIDAGTLESIRSLRDAEVALDKEAVETLYDKFMSIVETIIRKHAPENKL